jgi:hypothetical protein
VPGVAALEPATSPAIPPHEPAAAAPEERASAPAVPLLVPAPLDALGAAEERAAVPLAPAIAAETFDVERAVLASELALLENELAELRSELRARELDTRFADALARIDLRMEELRAQHRKVRALLERFTLLSTPSAGLAPAGGAPAHDPFEAQGVSR